MINSSKFKGRMIEKKYTFQTLAPKISCTPYTLGQMVANKTPMTLEKANILAKELGINDKEFSEFFLQIRLQYATKINATPHKKRRRGRLYVNYEKINRVMMEILERKYGSQIYKKATPKNLVKETQQN